MKGSIQGALLVSVMCFLVLFPMLLIFAELWSGMQPIITNQTITGNNATVSNSLTRLGNTFFYYMPDTIIVILYFSLIMALFISAIYENAHPETLPLGLLFMIPLIIITLPLSDMSHWFYSNSGFANVAGYFTATEYLSDYSPMITTLVTISYLIFVVSKKNMPQYSGSGGSVVSG